MPPQAAALTENSKKRVLDALDISTPDIKKRHFLELGSELVEEMLYLHSLSRYTLYTFLKTRYLEFRYATYVCVLLWNITLATAIVGPGSILVADTNQRFDFSWNNLSSRKLARVFNVLSILGYATLLGFCLVTRVYLLHVKVVKASERGTFTRGIQCASCGALGTRVRNASTEDGSPPVKLRACSGESALNHQQQQHQHKHHHHQQQHEYP